MRHLSAELRKLVSLRASLVAAGLCFVAAPAIAGLNGNSVRTRLAAGDTSLLSHRSVAEGGFEAVMFAVIAGIVLGVVIMSSEYTANAGDVGGGRQILATLTSVPRRGSLLVAKAGALTLVTVLLSSATIFTGLVVGQALLGPFGRSPWQAAGELGWRLPGAVFYCVCMALIAFAVTTITRSGVVPLIVLIVNGSLVSVSLLLSKVTSWAKFLPDAAGIHLFARGTAFTEQLPPLVGAAVLTAWTVLGLVVGVVVFARRDA
ncbi:ABC transporter permease [Lentzea rhizosphaerae]|uniref:ABC transporter permease n=1 Tax=Lentzea rhizosphaerae TaxID=2041025 RepID=A0ABV8BLT9_9PSEU